MPDERGTVRRIDWQELCPWLLILKSFRLAAGLRILTLMFVALVVSAAGWNLIGWVFSSTEDVKLKAWIEADSVWPTQTAYALAEPPDNPFQRFLQPLHAIGLNAEPVSGVWHRLSNPFVRIFARDTNFVELAYLILGCVWSLIVWALFGGAATRIAAVAYAREDRLGLFGAISFARRKWLSFLAGPLFPFVGVLMVVVPLFFLGLLFRASFFLLFSVILWPLVILAGLFLAVVTLGLLFGWPLMWGTIGTEGTDAFDALSRSYNYIRERPLHYLGYFVAAALFGAVCLQLVAIFAKTVVHLANWGVSWGLGNANMYELTAPAADAYWFTRFGGGTIVFFNNCVTALVIAFAFGFFWTAMTAVYMLMRLKVDATELDEVYLPEEDQSYGMPPLMTDAAGVPQVADAPPETDGTP